MFALISPCSHLAVSSSFYSKMTVVLSCCFSPFLKIKYAPAFLLSLFSIVKHKCTTSPSLPVSSHWWVFWWCRCRCRPVVLSLPSMNSVLWPPLSLVLSLSLSVTYTHRFIPAHSRMRTFLNLPFSSLHRTFFKTWKLMISEDKEENSQKASTMERDLAIFALD